MSFKPEKIYFTSDLHFFHKNIIKYCKRPWKDVDEMNKGLVDNWNHKVDDDSVVYIIGDLAMGGARNSDALADLLSSMKGKKYLVPGNHDTYVLKSERCIENIELLPPLAEITVRDPDANKGRQRIVMCHFAMKVWNRSHHGSWHLFGHSHHTMKTDYSTKSFDVGIDGKGYGYSPISYFEVKELMKKHNKTFVDHHNDNTY